MTKEYAVAALWIGGDLSFLEQLCLKSFVDVGQHTILYTYNTVGKVPEGVEIRDANAVLPSDSFIRNTRTNSPALHSDLFRYHMLKQNDDLIWVDTDAYCVKRFETETGHFHAYESKHGINGGVLGLPQDSETLRCLLEFTSDEYAIPEWYSPTERANLEQAKADGNPVHAGEMPWGVWGPHALTHYLKKTGEVRYTLPQVALYPVPFSDRMSMTNPGNRTDRYITDDTYSIHLYGRRMRARLLEKYAGIPKPNSLIGRLVTKHGIEVASAPIPPKKVSSSAQTDEKKPVNSDTLTEELSELTDVQSVLDIAGCAPYAVIDLYNRFNCDVSVADIGRDGNFVPEPESTIQGWLDVVQSAGIPVGRIKVIRDGNLIRPADLILAVGTFGDQWKIKFIEPFLKYGLHADSCLLLDIRKGSGAFPFLKDYGTNEILKDMEGQTLRRVLMRPNPPEPEADETWAAIAPQLAGPDGFFHEGPNGHSVLYVPRNPEVLVVTFDNLDIAMNKRDDRRPWGYEFIEKQGWSMLGVLAGGWTWYREPWVSQEFDRLRDEGFFSRFKRVVFYGASMGGYAAAAFSPACPGADVVAISPQSTLDRKLVAFETRYQTAWDYDYSGPYGDAAKVSSAANQVTILYDPYEPLDSGHVDRFTGKNVVKLRCPLLGHRLGSSLSQMGLLTPTILGALSGNLKPAEFYNSLRARHSFPRYQRELFKRAISRGRPDLARRVGRWVLARNDNRAIRQGMAELDQKESK